MRNALKPSSPNKWTRYINARGQFVIPYIFGGSFDAGEHATIAKAMLAISQNTCIKFQKRAGEADFVELKNERGEGCYTTVGRVPGKNVVMLETNNIATCLEFDIVVHELMHTIGLWHEQMRYDRDDYIKIHFENIAPVYYTQFEKISSADSTTYGIKYDYESVMHYAKDAFASAPGKITMETLNKEFQDVIGKVTDAAPSDYFKICNIYSCKKCMGKPWKPGRVTGDNSTITSSTNSASNTTTPPSPLPKTVNSTNIIVDHKEEGENDEDTKLVNTDNDDDMPISTAIVALPDPPPVVSTSPDLLTTEEQGKQQKTTGWKGIWKGMSNRKLVALG
uniref:Metalloendopeptidase n=1 Tax=Ditylenchus dipsaci TaxID=166011 RepID=A0A915CQJ8_9BILA